MYLRLEEYHRPDSLEACLELLGKPGAAPIAGGTRLNVEGHEDIRSLVDLQALPMRGIGSEGGEDRIGALTTLTELADGDLPGHLAALQQAAEAEPNLPLRNQSTLGGRLSRDRSDGRLATALLALGAEVEVHDSGAGERRPLSGWLERDTSRRDQLLAAAHVPGGLSWSGYLGFSQPVMAPPSCDAALSAGKDGVLIATGGHAAGAAGTVALPETAKFVGGLKKGAELSSYEAELRKVALSEVPAHGDLLAAGDWRQAVAVTLVVRLTERWLAEGGGA